MQPTFIKKQQKSWRSLKGVVSINPCKGYYTVVALRSARLSAQQLIGAKKLLARILKRTSVVQLCVFPHRALTRKPIRTRMGKGKGGVGAYASFIKQGAVIFCIKSPVPQKSLKAAIKLLSNNLPVQVKLCLG